MGTLANQIFVHFKSNNDPVYPFTSNLTANTPYPSYNSTLKYRISHVPAIVSGMPFVLEISIIDKDGKLYSIEEKSRATLSFSSTNVVVKGNLANAKSGVYKFEELQIISTPGTTVVGTLSFQDFETFGAAIDFINTPISISFSIRKCA